MTMKRIENERKEPHRRGRRPAAILVAAAAAVAMLSVTAFAAYENGWFGFDGLFGDKAELVQEHVVSYEEIKTPETPFTELSEEEQERVAAGDPESPYVGTTVTETDDYRFTLESILAGRNTIYEIIRMEPVSETGQANMGLETPNEIEFDVVNQGKGGSLDSRLLQSGQTAAWYLAIFNSNQPNQTGDLITTEVFFNLENRGAPLFTGTLPEVVELEETVNLNRSAYTSELSYFDTMTVTPMSMTIEGWFDFAYADQITEELLSGGKTKADVDIQAYEPPIPQVTITLRDGTAFRLKDGTTDTVFTEYGTYGTLLHSGQGDWETGRTVNTWTFSQIIDISEIDHITVDGVDYQLNGTAE